MPIVGLLTGGVDFLKNSLHWMVVIMILWMPLKEVGTAVITYGNLQATINFVIALFFFLRAAEK
jgi:large conductance mechanosensitive channel